MNSGRKKTLSIFCCWIFIFIAGLNSAYALTAQEIAKKAFNSTVLLVMEDANGQPLSLGSGFFVAKGLIATNLHVVEGAYSGYAKVVGENLKYDIEGIAAVNSKHDLAILKILNTNSPTLTLGDSEFAQVGEQVFAVGNPKGLEGTFSQGIISSIRNLGEGMLLQITAPISPGSSGGPVLNMKGEVIGVSVATYKGGQNLNFAIPSNSLLGLLSEVGDVRPLNQIARSKSKGSLLTAIGGSDTGGVTGEKFLWDDDYDNSYIRNQGFTFSLRNNLRSSVNDVFGLIIFYDSDGSPIEVLPMQYRNIIPAKLAKRVGLIADYSIKKLTTKKKGSSFFEDSPSTKVEFRILNFEIQN